MTQARPILPRDWRLTYPKEGGDWAEKAEFDELSRRSLSEHLRTVRSRGRLQPGEVAVMCVLRNEAARLPLFFEHYKKLGVDRFFMVDNDSSDGSHEILLAEPLADVFHTAASFYDSCFGIYWYNGLAREYCSGNWVLMADADELLVYDGMEAHGLRDLAGWLRRQGFDRLFGLMLDVYPSGAIGHGIRTIADILERDCWFDVDGYIARRNHLGWTVFGGSRNRLFERGRGALATLNSKYPFFEMTPERSVCNAHFIWPFDTSTNVAFGAFLHLKLMDDFIKRSAVNETEGQHWLGSTHYRRINKRLAQASDIVAITDRSRAYVGPASLVENHIMSAIAWDCGTALDHARPYLAMGRIAWRNWRNTLPFPGRDWSQRDEFIAISMRSMREHLKTVRCRGPLREKEFGLICVLRNEIARLPLFFEHYRKLGVTRFLMIDNGSDDGSHEFLLAQEDADIFLTHVPFGEGQAGLYWANAVAREFCIGHWILRVDADELLVYDGMEEHDLPQLAGWLEASGLDRMFAPLLDVYPSGPLGAERRNISDMLDHDCWFDDDGYRLDRVHAGWDLSGGARRRLFGSDETKSWPTLSRYPFFRMLDQTAIFDHHWQWPYDGVTEGPQGALLHLELTGDVAEQPDLVAFHEASRRYRGPRSLVRQSFMLPINWDEPCRPEEVEKRKAFLRQEQLPPDRAMWTRTLPERGTLWEARDQFNWESHWALSEQMRIIRCRGPLAPGEIGLVCVFRNEADRLPHFFAHYKKLGVTRFFMVDNKSDDGSHEIVLAEPQADIFLAHASSAEGLGGIYWVNGIAREFCRGRWLVHADADELLVYDRMEERSLARLGEWLEAGNRDRLLAWPIDVGDLGRGDQEQRLKHPFIRLSEQMSIVDAHTLWPVDAEKPVARGALLHLNLRDDFHARSLHRASPSSLIHDGLLEAIDWGA